VGEENKHTNVPSTAKDQTFESRPSFSTRRKHLKAPGEENKHPNWASTPKTGLLSQRSRLSSRKSNPEDGARIRRLYILSFVTNIIDCTKIP